MYELDGDVPTSEFTELMGWKEDDVDVESATIGGLTTELHGDFPEEGDCVTLRNAEIRVLQMDGLRVDRVLVTVNEDTPDDPEKDE